MSMILLIAALILFIIDGVSSLSARAAQYVRGTVLQSLGLACLVGSMLFAGGLPG